DRVRSMALIHDKLYQSRDLGKIDFFEYAQSLCYHLFQTYGVDPEKIRLDIQGEEMPVGVDRGVPCGLIVNELVSNCLKHAFPGGRGGTISVSVSWTGARARIVVADDGIGFPRGIDFRSTESLGLELVTTLTAQIDGTIELDASRGTRFSIEFDNVIGGGAGGK
ncbi:MAG: ATP-binding protein, partial [Thermoplasmata archaeon]|nr:ATP-binding protein [Thermoplasmata archaeon]